MNACIKVPDAMAAIITSGSMNVLRPLADDLVLVKRPGPEHWMPSTSSS
jgi:hypothetical protein